MEKIKNFFRSENGQVTVALILCLTLMLGTYSTVFLFTNRDLLVHAEELSSNSILNFNQLIDLNYRSYNFSQGGLSFTKNGNLIHVSGTNSATVWIAVSDTLSITNNSKLYVSSQYLYDDIKKVIIDSSYIMSSGTTYHFYLRLLPNTYNEDISLNVINLTQMFGSGNEPSTVEDVKKYLPLDYYAFSTGTPISLNYMDGFSSGMDAINSGFTVDQVASDFVNLAYSVDGSDITRNNNQLGFNGVIGITMKYTLIANDYIIIRLTCLSGTVFDIQQVGSNGQYINLQHVVADDLPNQITSGGGWTYCSGDLTIKLVNDASSIYFNGGGFITVSDVYYKTFNYNAALENSYKQGKQDYIDRELPAVLSKEYQRGKDDGIKSANDYSFISLFSALFDAPVKVLTGLLDFEVLGMNLKSFFFSLFTIFLVLALINFIMAKRGDKS